MTVESPSREFSTPPQPAISKSYRIYKQTTIWYKTDANTKDRMPKNSAGGRVALQPAGRELKPSVVAYKRERILEEAGALFFKMGYEAATLDMLAERLTVTKPFLYTYYRNKGHILSAICELGVQESLAALDTVGSGEGSSVDRLGAALAAVANIIIDRHQCHGPGSKRSREVIVKQMVHACMRLIGLG